MKKILVPTDCSDLSAYALTLAHKFARQTASEIVALKVVPTAADALFTKDGQLIDSGDYDMENIRKDMDESKKAIEDWAEKYQIPVKAVVRTGKLTEQVLHCIKNEQPDLVVMGTHGLHGLRELIADSVTEQLVRDSSVPVLSLKCDRSDLEIKNIVLASRFDKVSSRRISFLKELQQAFGATIHLLRIITPGDFKTTRQLKAAMQKFSRQNQLQNVEYHMYAAKEVEEGILHFTEDAGMDMICLGVEPERLAGLFRKEISAALVNHMYHPVLTFKV